MRQDAVPSPEQIADNAFDDRLAPLETDSILQVLPLYAVSLNINAAGVNAADCLTQMPELPGILTTDRDAIVSVLSRYRFLDNLLRPQGCEFFLTELWSALCISSNLA